MYNDDYIGFTPFVGVVKETETNRVRVRVFGVHPFDEEGQSSGPAQVAVSDGDLPWATLAYPIDSSGANQTLEEEDWVMGFFADGRAAQMPIVTGRIERADGSEGGQFGSDGPTSGRGGGNEPGAGGGSNNTGGAGPGKLIGQDGKPVRANKKAYYDKIPGGSNTQKAFNFYTTWLIEEQGMPKARAMEVSAGILGALAGESGKSLNPGAYNPNDRGKPSEGIAQWRAGRQKALWQMCGKNNGNLDCQLNFSISELENRGMGHRTENTERAAKIAVLNSSSAGQATEAWVRKFERPQHASAESRKRKRIYSTSTRESWKKNYQPATISSERTKPITNNVSNVQ